MSLLKSSAIIASLTMCSRLLGFARDMLIANTIGASWLSDAFFVAFKLPNFFRRLFAEGAFNAAFVPQFSGILATEGKQSALHFAGQALSFLLMALLALNAIFLSCMPWLLQFFAPGFTESPDKYVLTVELARICFPYILCISLLSLLAAVLNAMGKFAAAAAAPILLNISLISALFFIPAQTAAHSLSWGVFIAGIVQLIWLGIFAWKHQAMPHFSKPVLSPPIRKFFCLIAPAALGAGVAQVNLLIDVVLASLFPEGVSYLYYADRINQLPLGVIGVAVGTALLPMLSKYYKLSDTLAAHNSLNRAIELVLLFALPAMVAFITMPELLVQVLYEHGAFSSDDATATYLALIAYAAGLPAFVLIKILGPGFYANEDTKTPFYIALFCVGLNFVLNLIFMQFFAHVGLAIATSLSGWVNAGLMAFILHRRHLLKPDAALYKRLPRFALCAALMGGFLIALQNALVVNEMLLLAFCVVAGGGFYAASILGTKALSLQELKGYLRK